MLLYKTVVLLSYSFFVWMFRFWSFIHIHISGHGISFTSNVNIFTHLLCFSFSIWFWKCLPVASTIKVSNTFIYMYSFVFKLYKGILYNIEGIHLMRWNVYYRLETTVKESAPDIIYNVLFFFNIQQSLICNDFSFIVIQHFCKGKNPSIGKDFQTRHS